jgi:multidrug resistance efflux pump
MSPIQQWLDALCGTLPGVADAVVVQAGEVLPAARWPQGARAGVQPLLDAARSALQARHVIVVNPPLPAAAAGHTPRIVALPLLQVDQAVGAAAFLFRDFSAANADNVIGHLQAACARLVAAANPAVTSSETVLQVQAALLSQARFAEAAAVFATQLAQRFALDRVSVGLVDQGYARVVAISHGAAPEAQQELSRVLAAAMDEAIDQGATVCVPAAAGAPRVTLAHAALRRGGSGWVCSIPIAHLDAIAGAVTLERTAGQALDDADLQRCEHLVNLAGPLLVLKAESEVSALARMRRAAARLWRRLREPGEIPFKVAIAAGLAALLFALLVPLPYSVSAPVRLEGSVQRALAAAADGYVQQVSARPGDKVREGQVLAELAQHDLQLERSKRGSELAQHVNAYSAAFARADRASLMVSQAKMEEARAQLELVESQLERTQVKAPFDGVVISGDLTQQLGAPVQRGAVLMVVAPADGYRLIVEVDERDIVDVQAGAAGRVALAAMPGTAHAFRVERVTPLAGTRDGRHFFEVEGRLVAAAAGAALRPGLQGIARIDAEARPLAAMLFGRVANGLRLRLWSWGWYG